LVEDGNCWMRLAVFKLMYQACRDFLGDSLDMFRFSG